MYELGLSLRRQVLYMDSSKTDFKKPHWIRSASYRTSPPIRRRPIEVLKAHFPNRFDHLFSHCICSMRAFRLGVST